MVWQQLSLLLRLPRVTGALRVSFLSYEAMEHPGFEGSFHQNHNMPSILVISGDADCFYVLRFFRYVPLLLLHRYDRNFTETSLWLLWIIHRSEVFYFAGPSWAESENGSHFSTTCTKVGM